MWRASILLNLYGHQTVRRKLNLLQKPLKMHFSCKLSLHRTAWQPYRLSHIDALRINQSYYSKVQSVKVWWKLLSFWQRWKTQFFWVSHFDFFSKKDFFFCFIPMKISHKLCVSMDGTQSFNIMMVYSQKLVRESYNCMSVVQFLKTHILIFNKAFKKSAFVVIFWMLLNPWYADQLTILTKCFTIQMRLA